MQKFSRNGLKGVVAVIKITRYSQQNPPAWVVFSDKSKGNLGWLGKDFSLFLSALSSLALLLTLLFARQWRPALAQDQPTALTLAEYKAQLAKTAQMLEQAGDPATNLLAVQQAFAMTQTVKLPSGEYARCSGVTATEARASSFPVSKSHTATCLFAMAARKRGWFG